MQNNKLIPIAKIRKPHGVYGDVKCFMYSSDLSLFLEKLVVIGDFESKITELRGVVGEKCILRIDSIDSLQKAEPLRGLEIFTSRVDLPPIPASHRYWCDIIGMEVYNSQQLFVGVISSIANYGAGDIARVKCVRNKFKHFIISANSIRSFDDDTKCMVVDESCLV